MTVSGSLWLVFATNRGTVARNTARSVFSRAFEDRGTSTEVFRDPSSARVRSLWSFRGEDCLRNETIASSMTRFDLTPPIHHPLWPLTPRNRWCRFFRPVARKLATSASPGAFRGGNDDLRVSFVFCNWHAEPDGEHGRQFYKRRDFRSNRRVHAAIGRPVAEGEVRFASRNKKKQNEKKKNRRKKSRSTTRVRRYQNDVISERIEPRFRWQSCGE